MNQIIDADTGEVIAESCLDDIIYDIAFLYKEKHPDANIWVIRKE